MATQEETSKVELSPRKVAERLKDEGKQKLEEGKTTAAEQVDSVASALKSAGNELDQPLLATYANQLADSVSRFSTRLREGSVEDLVSDAQGMARRNPGLFILGGLAAGLLLARFIRASVPEDEFLAIDSDDESLDTGESSGQSSGVGEESPSYDTPSSAYSPPSNPAGSAGI